EAPALVVTQMTRCALDETCVRIVELIAQHQHARECRERVCDRGVRAPGARDVDGRPVARLCKVQVTPRECDRTAPVTAEGIEQRAWILIARDVRRTAQCALHLIEQAERSIRITAEAEGNAEPDEGKGEVRMAIGAPQELDRFGERGQYAGHLTHPERRVAERGE